MQARLISFIVEARLMRLPWIFALLAAEIAPASLQHVAFEVCYRPSFNMPPDSGRALKLGAWAG